MQNTQNVTRDFRITLPIARSHVEGGTLYIEGVASDASNDALGGRMAESAIVGFVNCVYQGTPTPVYNDFTGPAPENAPNFGIDSRGNTDNPENNPEYVTVDNEHSEDYHEQIGVVVGARVYYNLEELPLTAPDAPYVAPVFWVRLAIDINHPQGYGLGYRLGLLPGFVSGEYIKKPAKLGMSIAGEVIEYHPETDPLTGRTTQVFDLVLLKKLAITKQPANRNSWLAKIARSIKGESMHNTDGNTEGLVMRAETETPEVDTPETETPETTETPADTVEVEAAVEASPQDTPETEETESETPEAESVETAVEVEESETSEVAVEDSVDTEASGEAETESADTVENEVEQERVEAPQTTESDTEPVPASDPAGENPSQSAAETTEVEAETDDPATEESTEDAPATEVEETANAEIAEIAETETPGPVEETTEESAAETAAAIEDAPAPVDDPAPAPETTEETVSNPSPAPAPDAQFVARTEVAETIQRAYAYADNIETVLRGELTGLQRAVTEANEQINIMRGLLSEAAKITQIQADQISELIETNEVLRSEVDDLHEDLADMQEDFDTYLDEPQEIKGMVARSTLGMVIEADNELDAFRGMTPEEQAAQIREWRQNGNADKAALAMIM